MSVSAQPTDQSEIARRGDALYEERVRPNIDEDADRGKPVAIDVKSGDWELDTDALKAIDRLEERHPDAEVWLTRAGMNYFSKIGGRPRRSE